MGNTTLMPRGTWKIFTFEFRTKKRKSIENKKLRLRLKNSVVCQTIKSINIENRKKWDGDGCYICFIFP
jgi:hypothetical protein